MNPNFQPQTRTTFQPCRNCGLSWSPNHKDSFISKGKTCNSCGLQNHFSRVFRKAKYNPPEICSSNKNSIETIATYDSINAVSNIKYKKESKSDYENSIANIVASILMITLQIARKCTILQK